MAFSMKLPAGKKPLRTSASSGESGAKQYGLILPTKKDSKKDLKPASIFGVADSVDDDAPRDKAAERRRVGEEAARSFQKAKVERTLDKAMAEDASVFDYDSVYDQIQSSRQDKKAQRKAQRKSEKQSSKYISTLMEKAKVREIEHERITERRMIKEREAEDAMYGDKEKLISASYKRKLQEMQRWDDEEKRLDEREAAEDVTKRGTEAMAGFYSNLLTKNLAMGGTAAPTSGQRDERPPRGPDGGRSPTRHVDAQKADERGHERAERDVRQTGASEELPAAKRSKDHSTEERPTPTPVSEKTVVVEEVSKEEVISAARARFLARKAARQQESSSA